MRRTTLAALIAGLFVPPVQAQDVSSSIPLLDEIVVTATRTPLAMHEALAATTVIGRAAIQRSQASDLIALLAQQAGINVSRTGGEGKSTAIFVRGAASRHVLVLVDGVRAASASTGEYDWNALSPDQIERIEIVRGPLSSLYGSDAIGGVIQIFTRRNARQGVSVMLGSRGTRGIDVTLGGGEAWRYSLAAGRETTDGLPTFSSDSAAFGFNRNHLAFSLDGSLAENLAVGLRLNQAWGHNEQEAETGDNDYKNRTASLKLDHRISETWHQSLTLGNGLDHYTSYSPFIPAEIATRRDSLSWQHDIAAPFGRFTLGADFWNDRVSKDNSGPIDQRIENLGLYAQYRFAALDGEAQLGARRDKHDVFGGHHTWNLGWGRDLAPGLRLTASHGTAFKAPTVNDLFWPFSSDGPYTYSFAGTGYSDTYITQGNPALKPETSRSSELGLRYRQANWNAGVALYETRVRDLIEWLATVTPGGIGPGGEILTSYAYQPANVSDARMRGLELGGHAVWLDWDWQASYTRLLAVNLATGAQLDRRPQNSLGLSASRAFGPHKLRIEGSAHSDRRDIQGSTRLAGYGLVNAAYEYALKRDATLGLRLENLFDKDYALARTATRFYDAPGRGLFVTLRYQPR